MWRETVSSLRPSPLLRHLAQQVVLWRKVRGMPSVKTPSVSRDEPASGVLGKRERFRSKPLGGAIFAYSALGEITQILASSGSPK